MSLSVASSWPDLRAKRRGLIGEMGRERESGMEEGEQGKLEGRVRGKSVGRVEGGEDQLDG